MKNINVTKDIPIPKRIKTVKVGLILILLNEYVGTLLIKRIAITNVNIGTKNFFLTRKNLCLSAVKLKGIISIMLR